MRRGIFATRDELRSLADRIARPPFDAMYDALRKRCALTLQTPPVTETQWRASWEQGVWGAATTAARTAQGRMLDLLIAHHIDSNPAYRDRAAEELKSLIAWSTWADPCHAPLKADLCTAEAAVGAVVALDWLWEDLTEVERLRVLHAVRRKALDPYKASVAEKAWWLNVYHNWNAVVNSGCGLAGLALGDDEPLGREVHKKAMNSLQQFFGALGREGGWDEGVGYWGYAMRYVLLLGEAMYRLTDDRRVFQFRGMDATGIFPIYFTPNGQNASFGDRPSVPLFGTFYLLVKHFGVKAMTWWLDTYGFRGDAATSGQSSAGLGLLFRPIDAETADPELAPVKVFHEIGWAAMADHWPRPTFYAAVKTGDLAANHSQHDMNSLQLQVDGEMLLTDLGSGDDSREYLSDQRERLYEVQAAGHNTITIGERDHRIDAQGEIHETLAADNYRWVMADAGVALGENTKFTRHVVMLTETPGPTGMMLVVLDSVHNTQSEPMTLSWHTAGKIALDGSSGMGKILGVKAGLHLAISSTTLFTILAETRELPGSRHDNAIRVSASARDAMFLSVFSRRPVKDKPVIKASGGTVRLKIGKTDLLFKTYRKALELVEVTMP